MNMIESAYIESCEEETFSSSLSMREPESAVNISQCMSELNNMDQDQIVLEYSKCNKSNAIKNILYQFQDFIQSSGDQIVIESISEQQGERTIAQVRKEFHNFSKKKKLNQSFLVSVLKSKRFSIHFEYFLKYYTMDWILNGNIKNVKHHLLCIIFLQKCFEDTTLIEKIIKYKKRN
ncbi:hypothetical protein ABPG74_004747 [Tetrahymena malaccensis]